MSEAEAPEPQGTPCWVSLLVRDLPGARAFYGALFGWRFRNAPGPTGISERAELGGSQVAGIGTPPAGRECPASWTPYFTSDDADRTAQLIRAHCGTLAVGPLDEGGAARVLIASDPGGTVFGVCESRRTGQPRVPGEPGTVAWHELLTRTDGFLAAFYGSVLGHRVEPASTPFPGRELLLAGGQPVAGITTLGEELPRGRPPRWMTYFAVDDTDATAHRAARLGGRVVREPEDSPLGRVAVLADPEGAEFSVVESLKPV